MRKWFAIVFAALLGCSNPPRVTCSRSCQIDKTVRLDPTFSGEEVAKIWDGLNAWTEASNGSVCFVGDGQSKFDLLFIRGDNQTWLRPYRNDWKELAALHYNGVVIIAMDVVKDLRSVTAHEAGHVLGLSHAESKTAVMNFKDGTLIDGKIPPQDKKAFTKLRCR